MSQRELTRLEVIQRVKRKTLKQRQAAEQLSISVRQVKRLCKTYQATGAAGLISKRRGQPSNNRLPEKTINKAQHLLRSRYADFGPTLATEKLAIEGVSLSIETVRQLLIGEGLWKAKSVRRPVIHQLRERRARVGELVQIDGSPHDWYPSVRCWCSSMMLLRD
jgi:transposase